MYTEAGVVNVSDHGTIGHRKFWGSQKIFCICKTFQVNLYMGFLTIFHLVLH